HALEELLQLIPGDAGEDAGVGDLVTVQMEDRQNAAVPRRVEERVAPPAGGEWPGLGLAVADDAGDDQVRVVEGGAVGGAEGVAELAALVDAAGRLRGDVARDAAGKAELFKQFLHPLGVLADVRVDLAVSTLQVGVGHHRRAAVPRTDYVDHVKVIAFDDPVKVDAEDVQTRRGAPGTEQPRLDVLALERLLQEGVVEQVDLADGQVVQGPKVSVHLAQFFRGERAWHRLTAVRGFPFRLGGYGCHRSFPWVLGSSSVAYPLECPAAIRRAALLRPAAGLGRRSAGPPLGRLLRWASFPAVLANRGRPST